MHKFHDNQLQLVFSEFFKQVSDINNYNTRHVAKQAYALPKVKNNHGLSSIKCEDSQTRNSLNKSIKQSSLKTSKKSLFNSYIENIVD